MSEKARPSALVGVSSAATLLKQGELVALPTETVYGLAGRIDRPETLKKIFQIKKRPTFDPLIVHLAQTSDAARWASEWSIWHDELAQKFWPGPLTLVVKKSPQIHSLITAGHETVGLRVPRHDLTLQVLKEVGVPLAAPSANKFGKTSPTRAEHVVKEFSGEVPVLDGGACEIGLESSVVRLVFAEDSPHARLKQIEILRPGMISADDLRKALPTFSGEILTIQSQLAPGHVREHYQPRQPLILVNQKWRQDDLRAQLGHFDFFSPKQGELKLSVDATLAARELYAELHKLSQSLHDFLIYYYGSELFSESWQPLRNRLERAASFFVDENGELSTGPA